jgi:putative hemolysin
MELLVIVGLILLNGVFSGAEIALLSVRKTRLQELADEGDAAAVAALALRHKPESFLATVQVGITVVGATASAFGGSTLTGPLTGWLGTLGAGKYADELALALVVGFISVLSVVLGELVPKSISLRSSERVSLIMARPLLMLSRAASPLVWFLTVVSNLILRPFKDETSFVEGKLSADELQQLVEEAGEAGSLDEDVSEIASRAIDLAQIRIGALAIPRTEMTTLDHDASVDDVWSLLKKEPHARYPVRGADRSITGYVTARDLVLQLVEQKKIDTASILRELPFFAENTPAVDVLRGLQRGRQPLGGIVDEHGAVLGIVTVDDIMEELVGDVLAEHESPETHIKREGDKAYVVQAKMPVHELNRELELDLPQDPSYATLAGLLIHVAGHIPRAGEEHELSEHVRAKVIDASPRQVRTVRLELV